MIEQQTPDREKKIAEIRETLEKATPGTWKWIDPGGYERKKLVGEYEIMNFGASMPYSEVAGQEPDDADAHLIANAPEWLRFLLDELERKDEVIEEQKRQLFYKSQEITELREKSWQDQQWFKQASANITEMQKELDRIEREYAEERAAHNAHVTELCELEQERNKLIECLRFYERMARGREINDGGRRARTALAEIGVSVE